MALLGSLIPLLLAALGVAGDEVWTCEELLALERVSRGGRSAVFTDPIESALARGSWQAPVEGDTVAGARGEKTWKRLEAGEDGAISGKGLGGGYAYATCMADQAGIYLLEARGHRHLYVNGAPRAGDVYNSGIMRIPVALRPGENELLFKIGRGNLRARLVTAPAAAYLERKDPVLPDLLRGEADLLWGGITVGNATTEARDDLVLEATLAGQEPIRSPIASLPGCSIRKVPFRIGAAGDIGDEELELSLRLLDGSGEPLHAEDFSLPVRDPSGRHRRTFVSGIDGSVQYFAVTPPAGPLEHPALFLSLHGAGVEATNQANSYAAKDWGVVVAPTNRRPFGFDWEDWGRIDALEVLAEAERLFDTDPDRTYLTGHSMGGHGTWNLGAHMADRFAAIAPSAGWRDFWSYGGGAERDLEDPVAELLLRAANPSRTLLLERNFEHQGVYVLHGSADNNVPVTQAREMRRRLAEFHSNFAYYEKEGAGHWWGGQCVDWPPLFEFLRQNVRTPDHQALSFTFTTVHPGIRSRCHWLEIEAQQQGLAESRVTASLDPKQRRFTLETENVSRLALHLGELARQRERQKDDKPVDATVLAADANLEVILDEETLERLAWPENGLLRLAQVDGRWQPIDWSTLEQKRPQRMGPFKDAFRRRMLFVHGTAGTAEENEWAFAKARYDAETFHYRGNGGIEIVADVDFDPLAEPDRNVILYGNATTNRAWPQVLQGQDVLMTSEHVRLGERGFEADDLALLFTRPRKGSDEALVAVVGGTGIAGMRLTNQLPYFVSGVALPDWTLFSCDLLDSGWEGVLGTGFFRNDWSFDGVFR